MTTRAVSVIVERSPGGGGGRFTMVGGSTGFAFGSNDEQALEWVSVELVVQGTDRAESDRVMALLRKELRSRSRVEVTAEVRA